ncbi:hypothetical protein L6164_013289 [Bauhinia variegata]|uniref:Uncharacterized protein n=1 Tax=Bauhinia variegata TaxID=167791 RepID=A0ACB9PI34_BAUVA|nr:hypothetical protein L6164_013289 [Bauhinia variegata]
MNGAVEVANKNIKRIIEKIVITYKDCHERLPFALYAYRTSVRSSTKATPYSLVYGLEVVTPIKVKISSLRMLMEAELEDLEWARIIMGNWLQLSWPYVVIHAFSRGALVLIDMDGRELSNLVNSDAVKKYYP